MFFLCSTHHISAKMGFPGPPIALLHVPDREVVLFPTLDHCVEFIDLVPDVWYSRWRALGSSPADGEDIVVRGDAANESWHLRL